MKIAVFSDSHRYTDGMLLAISGVRPDAVVHLGDNEDDADEIRRAFPDIPVSSVCGNCDYSPLSPTRIIAEFNGKYIFACHGHTYGVKSGMEKIVNTALLSGADILLYGHTHRAVIEEYDGLLIINPGAAGENGTYCIITVEGDRISAEIRNL